MGFIPCLTTAFGKPFTAPGFTNWFREVCDEAGLPKGTSAHGLRKAMCRRLTEAGCSASEIKAIVDDIKPALLVAGGEFKEYGLAHGIKTLTFAELPRGWEDPHRDADGAVSTQFCTSGTTGLPKGAMLTGANLLNTGLCLALEMPEMREGGRSLVCMPMFHTGGTGWAVWSMQEGMTLVVVLALSPHLPYCKVTDAAIKDIAVFKNLATLELFGTQVTEQGVAALRQALPKCKISR